MTEQQIKRIREAVNTPDTAVYCADIQEREQLFDANEWDKNSSKYQMVLRNYPESCCFRRDDKDSNGWGYSREEWYKQEGFRVVKLHTLLTPEPCGLAKALGVEEGREFTCDKYPGKIYRIRNGRREVKPVGGNGESWRLTYNEEDLACMLNNPREIHPVRVWGEETIEDAKAAVRLGFDMVNRDSGGEIIISHDNDAIVVPGFKELQPGECVALADIVGGYKNG